MFIQYTQSNRQPFDICPPCFICFVAMLLFNQKKKIENHYVFDLLIYANSTNKSKLE